MPATPVLDFESASHLVLDYLNANVPLALWSVTRVENGRQTFLYLDEGNGYHKVRGDSHSWQDSFCVHMAAGQAPAVAPDAQAVPQYSAAGVNRDLTIGTYAGAAILEPDGDVFGAICGLDPVPHTDDAALATAAPLLRTFGQLLTMTLAADRLHERLERDLVHATTAADTDALTGLGNRRAWERATLDTERHFARYADPTVAVMLDMDRLKQINDTQGHEAGDRHICACAAVLRECVTDDDVVARLGGDEFGLLLRNCTEVHAQELLDRISSGFESAGVACSVGWAPLTVQRGLPDALRTAEEAMYEMKRSSGHDRRR